MSEIKEIINIKLTNKKSKRNDVNKRVYAYKNLSECNNWIGAGILYMRGFNFYSYSFVFLISCQSVGRDTFIFLLPLYILYYI
jgi:hypothetical protein